MALDWLPAEANERCWKVPTAPHTLRGMLTEFSLYPISSVARDLMHGGADDENFDDSALPFPLIEGATIEDISSLISADEFGIHKAGTNKNPNR